MSSKSISKKKNGEVTSDDDFSIQMNKNLKNEPRKLNAQFKEYNRSERKISSDSTSSNETVEGLQDFIRYYSSKSVLYQKAHSDAEQYYKTFSQVTKVITSFLGVATTTVGMIMTAQKAITSGYVIGNSVMSAGIVLVQAVESIFKAPSLAAKHRTAFTKYAALASQAQLSLLTHSHNRDELQRVANSIAATFQEIEIKSPSVQFVNPPPKLTLSRK